MAAVLHDPMLMSQYDEGSTIPISDEYGDGYLADMAPYTDEHSHFDSHPGHHMHFNDALPVMGGDHMNPYDGLRFGQHRMDDIPTSHSLHADGDESGDYHPAYQPTTSRRKHNANPKSGMNKYLNISNDAVKQQRADARRARNRIYAKECRARKKEAIGTMDSQLAEAHEEIRMLKDEVRKWKQMAQGGHDTAQFLSDSMDTITMDTSVGNLPVAITTRRMSSTGVSQISSPPMSANASSSRLTSPRKHRRG